MASTSEKSFAQRYTKARELVEYLTTITDYAPTSPDLETPKLTELLNIIDTANSEVSSKLFAVQSERDARYALIRGDNGLIKRVCQIRDYIASVLPEGKKAKDFLRAQKIVQRMRGKRLTKKPPLNPDGSVPKTISVMELSFGSLYGGGKELLELIKAVSNYAPSNANSSIANFTAFLTEVDAKNSSVSQKYEQYDGSIESRAKLYDELQSRITKVKLALAAQYGKSSNEYKDVVKY